MDIVLLASGCKVVRGNIFIKILDLLMLLLIISCYGATLFASIENYRTGSGSVLLSMVERYSNEVCGLVFIFIIRSHRNDINNLLMSVTESLEARQKSSVKRFSLTCLIVIIMTIVQDALLTRFHILSNSYADIDLQHEIMDWLRTYHNMNSWLLGGCCVFAFFVRIIKFNEINYFNRLEETPQDLVPEKSSSLILERKAVILTRKRLLKCFSIIPCLWFMHVFVRGPIIVMEVNSDKINWIEKG